MKIELKFNKEQLVTLGKGAGKIGKAIIVEGTKAVALKGAAAVITQSFDKGPRSVKELDLDDMLNGGKKPKKAKKKLFAFKKKDEGTIETEVKIDTDSNDAEAVAAETEFVEVEMTK